MKINRRVSLRSLQALVLAIVFTTFFFDRAGAQMPQGAVPTSTAEKAVGSHILRSTYNATGDTTSRVAVFEVLGKPRMDHPNFSGPAAGRLFDRGLSGALQQHATGVVGILASNTARGAYTGGTARGYRIYLYTRSGEDMRGYFTKYYAERQPGGVAWNISNHSYGSTVVAGWRNEGGVWIWYGGRGTPEAHGMANGDPKFGWYSPAARDLDTFLMRHPEQIVVFSVGNHMGEGPNPGGPGFYVRHRSDGRTIKYNLTDSVPAKNGWDGGFDCIEGIKTSKNAITVGSVTPADNAQKWIRTSFSSTGPVDDGRIKPDVMAYGGKGLDVLKNTGSALDSGTSYAAPAVSGVLAQLAQIWQRTDAAPMWSSTARALLCHTATDLGRPGPDYEYGWGLVDGGAAGALLTKRAADGKFALQERVLKNGTADTFYIKAPAKAKVKVTIAWTDVQATPIPAVDSVAPLNNRSKMLRNDLDVTLYPISGATDQTVGSPLRAWVLNVANPAATATRAPNSDGNTVDNIEQATATAPATITATQKGIYMIVVKHKGTLRLQNGTANANATQAYSIAISNGSEYFPAPRSIAALQMGATDARVTWRAIPNAASYEIQYRKVGANTWQTKAGSLTPHTDFLAFAAGSWQMRVRARRAATVGTWSDAVAFYVGTPPGVTGMHVTNITTSSAQLHWNAIPGTSRYEVAYAIVNHEGTPLFDFNFKYTTENKTTISNLPADELVAWFVNVQVDPSAESGYMEGGQIYIPLNCASYEPGNNSTIGARVMRVNEQFLGLICSNEEADWFRIDPRDHIADRYLQLYLHAHPMPYELRLWRKAKGQGGTLSAVANVSKVFHPVDDRIVNYNALDFYSYDYFVEVKTPVKGSIYDDFTAYSFWADTRNSQPYGNERRGEEDPSMSMQRGGTPDDRGRMVLEAAGIGMAP